MLIDKELLEEYPFEGEFYTYEKDDSSWGADPIEKVVLSTVCDIQESQKSDASGNLTATFNVYFPFDVEAGIELKRGMYFRGSMYGIEVNGEVIGLFPTQMGGCACYIKTLTV